MPLPESISRVVENFVSDVKHSLRFKVAAVLWIPLFITVMIAIIHLGVRHTISMNIPDWRTQYVNEDSGISYPDVTVQLSTPTNAALTFGRCNQRGVQAAQILCQTSNCFSFRTSAFQASAAYEGNNHITCQFGIQGQNTDNTELNVTVPQGYIWQPNPPTYVQANVLAEVDFYYEGLHTMDGKSADEWWTQVTYRTSDFFYNNASAVFTATIMFLIPIRAHIENYQYVSFDSWQLLANWGGIIFFMWFLHSIVYGFAKFFLPNDSKLFPDQAAASAAYEPIQ